MASIIQIGEKWRAQVRRKHHKPHTRTFRTRKEAQEWARQIESRIDAGVGPKTSALIKAGRSLGELLTQRLPFAKSGRHRITGPLYDAVDLFSCDRPIGLSMSRSRKRSQLPSGMRAVNACAIS